MYKESLLYTAKVEGEKRGIEKGLKQGLEQGIKQEKLEIAKVSLKQNIDIQTISLITGLSIEEIKKLG